MEIHFDTEFLNTGDRIWLISIGMIREDGKEYYAVNSDMPAHAVRSHHWLGKNVWPHLPRTEMPSGGDQLDYRHKDVKSEGTIRGDILRFVSDTDRPSLWSWYGSHDYVVTAQIFGVWPETPMRFPQRTNDVAQEWERLGYPPMPEQSSGLHHPLEDARFCLFRRTWLKEYEKQGKKVSNG